MVIMNVPIQLFNKGVRAKNEDNVEHVKK
jgi:hypothetical protein